MLPFRKFMENKIDLANLYKNKLRDVPQDPIHHPEGNVLVHIRLVRKAIPKAIQELRNLQNGKLNYILSDIDFSLTEKEHQILAMSAWIHDIGKTTATTINGMPWQQGGVGKIQAIGHQDKEHFIPQLKDLESIAPAETKKLYYENSDIIDWLVEHHMDFTSGQGFSKKFIKENFDGRKIKPSERMKLLLILMWADKMGRNPEETIQQSLDKNVSNLIKSSDSAVKIHKNIEKKSIPFGGSPEDFSNMLKQRGVSLNQRIQSVKNKFPFLSPEEIKYLTENIQSSPTILKANIPLPKEVYILDKALKQGDENTKVYVVGGAVRDYLFHLYNKKQGIYKPKDVDLTTNISEEQILERLRSSYAQELGIKVKEKESIDTFGVVFASVNGSETLEIAPFRKDIGSVGGRRPERVEQADIYEDAMRRDLTINNLYYDFDHQQILDFNPHGQGIDDIRKGIARPVGNPFQRFDEDKLRVLRLVRFFSRFNNGRAIEQLDPETISAIEHFKDLQKFGITRERIYQEFISGIKQSLNTSSYLQNYADLDLFKTVFPGLIVDTNGINRLGNLKNVKVILAWLLRDNNNISTVLNSLKYPKEISDSTQFLIDAIHLNPDKVFNMIKRRDKNTNISFTLKNDLKELAQVVNEPQLIRKLLHLSNYDMLTMSGQDLASKGLKGKEIGDEQQRQGTHHYTQSFKDFLDNS